MRARRGARSHLTLYCADLRFRKIKRRRTLSLRKRKRKENAGNAVYVIYDATQ